MTGTKNGVQQKAKKSLRDIDPKVYGLLSAFGLLSALAIQTEFSPSGLTGAFLVSTILLLMFYRDIVRYKPAYAKNYPMLFLLGLLVAGTMLSGRLSGFALDALAKGLGREGGAAVFGVPLAAGAMLVTLLFDFHMAIFFSFVVSILGGLWLGDPAFSLYVFVGSLTGAFGLIRCKKRTAILRSGAYVLAANLLAAASIYMLAGKFFTHELPLALIFALFGAAAATAIVSIMLPVLEYLFGVTTDISLLELLDLDQPLMKSLMIQAPGTYHHSIIVGNMVDSVSESVGVNPLLARAAAYYHDIGKVKMPEYFIENSPQAVGKHEKLTPHMSSMILISHVKEGVELGKQYKLPMPIVDIIQQHHGSSLITYFFQKAKGIEASKGLEADEELSEEAYRYQGPRPQSRVAALVMMADAVEAASRVLSDPTPARVKGLVDKIIDHMYLEGQLDECELTLKDITEVKRRFTHILTGILHKRIDYPGFDFEGARPPAPGAARPTAGQGKKNGSDKQQPKEDKAKSERDRARFPEGVEDVRTGSR